SHSNARKICGVARNLSDEMILALHEKGGVMGLNFCGDFLSEDRTNTSRIEDMIQHIDHIKKIAGIDVIGIGSDFDGINSQLEIADASQFDLLANALLEHGYSQEEVEKIFYKNVLRVYSQVLPE
ncbi:dipeptidase, partial [Dubosiella newyorkensis]